MAVAGESDAPRMLLIASKRRVVLLALVAAHLFGLTLILMDLWPWGLGLIVASHLMIFWGTLVPDSSLLTAVVRNFSSARDEVWLSIDDGPSDDTGAMLDLLDQHAAHATFFLVADRAAARPDCVSEIQRRGHSIGNHTASHPSAWFWALPPAAMRRQIGAAQLQLTTLAGTPPRLFRAAVGMSNPFVAPLLEQHGLIRIGWSARGYDSVSARPETVWARLRRGLRPGAILLLHEDAAHGNSVATMGYVLQQLDALGYRCVLPELPENGRSATTSQLLNGVPPHSGENRTLSPAPPSSASSASRSG
jgi:peptidoglycan/xylan/chitin deacetylase (PgdA/CDA1 family)